MAMPSDQPTHFMPCLMWSTYYTPSWTWNNIFSASCSLTHLRQSVLSTPIQYSVNQSIIQSLLFYWPGSFFRRIGQVPDERLLSIILPDLFWLHYVTVKSLLECCWNRPLNLCSVVRLGNLKRHRSQLGHCVSLNIGPSRYMVNLNFIKLGESSLGLFLCMAAALHLLPHTQRWLVSLLAENHPSFLNVDGSHAAASSNPISKASYSATLFVHGKLSRYEWWETRPLRREKKQYLLPRHLAYWSHRNTFAMELWSDAWPPSSWSGNCLPKKNGWFIKNSATTCPLTDCCGK